MRPKLGSATLSQLAFPGECDPIFPWEQSHWDNTAVKSKSLKKKKEKKKRVGTIVCMGFIYIEI